MSAIDGQRQKRAHFLLSKLEDGGNDRDQGGFESQDEEAALSLIDDILSNSLSSSSSASPILLEIMGKLLLALENKSVAEGGNNLAMWKRYLAYIKIAHRHLQPDSSDAGTGTGQAQAGYLSSVNLTRLFESFLSALSAFGEHALAELISVQKEQEQGQGQGVSRVIMQCCVVCQRISATLSLAILGRSRDRGRERSHTRLVGRALGVMGSFQGHFSLYCGSNTSSGSSSPLHKEYKDAMQKCQTFYTKALRPPPSQTAEATTPTPTTTPTARLDSSVVPPTPSVEDRARWLQAYTMEVLPAVQTKFFDIHTNADADTDADRLRINMETPADREQGARAALGMCMFSIGEIQTAAQECVLSPSLSHTGAQAQSQVQINTLEETETVTLQCVCHVDMFLTALSCLIGRYCAVLPDYCVKDALGGMARALSSFSAASVPTSFAKGSKSSSGLSSTHAHMHAHITIDSFVLAECVRRYGSTRAGARAMATHADAGTLGTWRAHVVRWLLCAYMKHISPQRQEDMIHALCSLTSYACKVHLPSASATACCIHALASILRALLLTVSAQHCTILLDMLTSLARSTDMTTNVRCTGLVFLKVDIRHADIGADVGVGNHVAVETVLQQLPLNALLQKYSNSSGRYGPRVTEMVKWLLDTAAQTLDDVSTPSTSAASGSFFVSDMESISRFGVGTSLAVCTAATSASTSINVSAESSGSVRCPLPPLAHEVLSSELHFNARQVLVSSLWAYGRYLGKLGSVSVSLSSIHNTLHMLRTLCTCLFPQLQQRNTGNIGQQCLLAKAKKMILYLGHNLAHLSHNLTFALDVKGDANAQFLIRRTIVTACSTACAALGQSFMHMQESEFHVAEKGFKALALTAARVEEIERHMNMTTSQEIGICVGIDIGMSHRLWADILDTLRLYAPQLIPSLLPSDRIRQNNTMAMSKKASGGGSLQPPQQQQQVVLTPEHICARSEVAWMQVVRSLGLVGVESMSAAAIAMTRIERKRKRELEREREIGGVIKRQGLV